MNISYIEMAGFRGFRDKVRLEFPAGFVVITGRNGVGKSTVLDAFDYVLTGTINKYAVTGAKGGGLDQHIWWVGDGDAPDHYVTIGLRGEGGGEVAVTRSRRRGLVMPEHELAHHLCLESTPPPEWKELLVRTTLLRDETMAALSLDLPEQARFNTVKDAIAGLEVRDHSGRTAEVLTAANTQLGGERRRLEDLHSELGRGLSSLTEAKSAARREPDVAEAEGVISSLAPELAESTDGRRDGLRSHIARLKVRVSELGKLAELAKSVDTERARLGSAGLEAAIGQAHAQSVAAGAELARAREEAEQAQARLVAEQTNDEFASHMVALLEHGRAVGLQDGHCPLCAAERTSPEFKAAVDQAYRRLEERGERARVALESSLASQAHLQKAEARFRERAAVMESYDLARAKVKRDAAMLAARLADLGFEGQSIEPVSLADLVLAQQERVSRLEYAAYLLDASSAHSQIASVERRLAGVRESIQVQTAAVAVAERAASIAKQIHDIAQAIPNQILTEQFDTVMPLLKELYRRLRPHADWQEIDVDFGGKIRASLNLTVGGGHNPQFLFSSGQRRAAGVAFLLSILLSRPWSPLNTVLLDDPVQHIDDYRALNLVEVLSAVRRSGRQVVISVEDIALAEVLCRRLRSSPTAPGRRFDLAVAQGGTLHVERQEEIFPLPGEVLYEATA